MDQYQKDSSVSRRIVRRDVLILRNGKKEKKQAQKCKREREACEAEKKSISESESEEEEEEDDDDDDDDKKSKKFDKIQNSRILTMNRKQFKANKQQRLIQVLNEGPENNVSIIVDCSFNSMMTPREIVSMSQQLMFCYSLNSKIETKKPFFLSFTSLEGALREATMKVSGFSNWIVDHTEQHFTERFSDMYKANKIIYLSADADEELTHLQQGTMYVLGGLVDRNRHKNLCHKRAMELGIHQAKFPIGQYLNLKQAPVLTVNQCFHLLATVYENGGNWKEAVEKVVPQRKRKVDKSITESNEQGQ